MYQMKLEGEYSMCVRVRILSFSIHISELKTFMRWMTINLLGSVFKNYRVTNIYLKSLIKKWFYHILLHNFSILANFFKESAILCILLI